MIFGKGEDLFHRVANLAIHGFNQRMRNARQAVGVLTAFGYDLGQNSRAIKVQVVPGSGVTAAIAARANVVLAAWIVDGVAIITGGIKLVTMFSQP